MQKHIIQFFKFLEQKEGKSIPLKLKLLYPEIFGKPTKEELVVKGQLDLTDCSSLTELPQGLKVAGSLYLAGCKSLKELPKGLKVGNILWVRNTPIADKYSKEQIRSMIEDGGGYVEGQIYT